ncbi:FixH family protein [Balneola sp. MJW-20]|uniref:FixH family protein n=1 Tax=Gracilimonas aurantiaca TaxID=3234185 RepID=UPI0034657161
MKKFNWGTGIFLAVTVFIIATLSVVSYLISLDFYLVSNDHYEQGVEYQQTIDSKERADKLDDKVVMLFDEENVALKMIFPPDMAREGLNGEVTFYRPNDSGMDRKIRLQLNEDRTQSVSMRDFEKGKWIMTLSWEVDSLTYIEEKTVII